MLINVSECGLLSFATATFVFGYEGGALFVLFFFLCQFLVFLCFIVLSFLLHRCHKQLCYLTHIIKAAQQQVTKNCLWIIFDLTTNITVNNILYLKYLSLWISSSLVLGLF